MDAVSLRASPLAGRFQLECEVGSGGMGRVYRAIDGETGRTVAVKLLNIQGGSLERERFSREATTLALLRHPHIVSYVAHGLNGSGEPYLAMEWLEGEDLAARLARGPLSLSEAATLARGLASALAAAHDAGVVHRDIKPSNIFLRSGDIGSATILDFGIARRTLRSGTLTRTGVVVGTPEYMAPEQARGTREVGPSSDLFSLGCVLYECLVGRPPFVGEHLAAVLVKILFEDPPAPHLIRAGVPVGLGELIMQLLKKDPGARLRSAAAVSAALSEDLLAEISSGESLGLEATLPGKSIQLVPPEEQRLYSVTVLVPQADDRGEAIPPTLTPQQQEVHLQPFKTLRDLMARGGGQLEVLADGSIIATAPLSASATDQALLAVRCALLLKERMPAAAVAVATGKGQLREQIPIGEAVDRALQLLNSQSRDTTVEPEHRSQEYVLVDALTHQLLDARFVTQERGGQTVVLREQTDLDASRPILGQPTACVGREQELAVLESALASSADESAARLIGILAEPGMGKSRLRHEFVRRVERNHADLCMLHGRGDLMSRGTPYAALSSALRRLCEIQWQDSPSLQREKLRRRVAQVLPITQQEHAALFLGELAGVAADASSDIPLQAARRDPRVMHDQLRTAFVRWLRAEAVVQPVALLVEDFQWADTLTAQLIEYVMRECRDLPILVLLFSRPEARELFPALFQPQRMQEVVLRPLSKKACERLILQVLARAQEHNLNLSDVSHIVAQAAGHPLLLEELLRAALAGQRAEHSETVQAHLQARIAQLEPLTRRVLRVASVFGELFPIDGILDQLGGESSRASVDLVLQQLVQWEFIERATESRWPGHDSYRFRHTLLREATYGLLTDEEKRQAHRAAASALARLQEHDPLIIAEHYRRGSLHSHAAPWLLKAADAALCRNDLRGAQQLAQIGLESAPKGELRGHLLAIQFVCLFWVDLAQGADDIALEALSLLPKGGRRWLTVAGKTLGLMTTIGRLGEFAMLVAILGQTVPDADAGAEYCECVQYVVFSCSLLAQPQSAKLWLSKFSLIEKAHTDTPSLETAWKNVAWHTFEHHLGVDPWQCHRHITKSIEIFDILHDKANYAIGISLGSLELAELGLFEEANISLERALVHAKKHDIHLAATIATIYKTLVVAFTERLSDAADESNELYNDMSNHNLNPHFRGMANGALCIYRFHEGRRQEAQTFALESIALLGPCIAMKLFIYAYVIRIFVAQQKLGEALAAADDAQEQFRGIGHAGHHEIPFRVAVIEALAANGKHDAARALTQSTVVQLQHRAERIPEPRVRASYLGRNPFSLRLRELSRELLGKEF